MNIFRNRIEGACLIIYIKEGKQKFASLWTIWKNCDKILLTLFIGGGFVIAVKVICIGKLKESYLRAACDEYTKRLARYCDFEVKQLPEVLISENPSAAQIDAALKKEAEAIEREIPQGAYTVALCIEGKQLSSPELAEKIEALASMGRGKISFIIGSSFGLDAAFKERCDLRLSFSKMTFPHQLFRVLLCEQIYRAFSIINKSKYHK